MFDICFLWAFSRERVLKVMAFSQNDNTYLELFGFTAENTKLYLCCSIQEMFKPVEWGKNVCYFLLGNWDQAQFSPDYWPRGSDRF